MNSTYKPQDAAEEEEKENVGVHNPGKKFLAGRELKFVGGGMIQGELDGRAVEAFDFPAVQLFEEIRVVFRDEVDQVPCQGFIFGEGLRIGDRGFGELGVAPALLGEAAEKRRGVVVEFFAQHFVNWNGKSAGEKNRRGSAGMRARSHGGDIRGQKDEEAGGGAACAGGRNVNGDRNGRLQNVMDDVGHRIAEPAWGIHGDEHQRGVAAGGVRESLVDVSGKHRLDFLIQLEFQNQRRVLGFRRRGDAEKSRTRATARSKSRSQREISTHEISATSFHWAPPVGLPFSRCSSNCRASA